jgi:hypothetical protein
LVRRPVTELNKLVDFLGIQCTEHDIAASVYWSSFDNRRREENETDFKERPANVQHFFRRGQVGAFKDEVPEAVQADVIKKYGDLCEKLGYKLR